VTEELQLPSAEAEAIATSAAEAESAAPEVAEPEGAEPPPVTPAEGRQRALVVLEVLAGLRGVPEAAQELGLEPQGYYHLEERAVKGLVEACVARERGPRRDLTKELAHLRTEYARIVRECARYQALLRTTQLSVGIDSQKKPPIVRQRKKRPTVRALRAIRRLKSPPIEGK
jgi:hypothetical protein